HVFDITPDGHRPTGVEEMMHDHQKERSQAKAQVKHVGEQPGVTELCRVPYPAGDGQDTAHSHQDVRRITPAGQVQWRVLGRSVMCAHFLKRDFNASGTSSTKASLLRSSART